VSVPRARAEEAAGAEPADAARDSGRGEHSPGMKQFFRCKAEHPDALLFFRMGDFYELFFEDAVAASKALDLTLTSRSKSSDGAEIPMAGVPHHAAASYLARLLEQGFKVAICEQMADPKTVKGIVPREVVRVVTPGLTLDEGALDARTDNLIVAIAGQAGAFALASLELSRAEVQGCVVDGEARLFAEVLRLEPREVVLGAGAEALEPALRKVLPRSRFDAASHADPPPIDPSVLALGQAPPLLVRAAEYVVRAARASQPRVALRLGDLITYEPSRALGLDDVAVRNLELVRTLGGDRVGSLLHLVDLTESPMGSRTMRRRLLAPLTELPEIRARLDRVEALARRGEMRAELRTRLAGLGDLERLATRAELGVATPMDLGALSRGLAEGRRIVALLDGGAGDGAGLGELAGPSPLAPLTLVDDCGDVQADIARTLVEAPPYLATQGGLVREGVEPRLDELRAIGSRSKDLLLALEERERSAARIASLKVRFTKVFGYYLEVTRANLHLVPPHFRRKQTVANGERFTTDELDALADDILHAEERGKGLEQALFESLRQRVGAAAGRLRRFARALGDLDAEAALAELAERRGYVRPELTETPTIELVEARHPVVETLAAAGSFVPNDLQLDATAERLLVITGPNMAGKSTTMRQVALAVILAQMGSFVPASKAKIGIVDRIFTRVGASDNLARGESTFMVEMRETAALLAGATTRSLVLLDEIGRGTSTYDGLAIAWSVAEHLVDRVRCRALFATHYHELCALEGQRPGHAINWNVSAKERGGDVVFLHRLQRGPSHRSFGIAVARLAGLPETVVRRARALLGELEASRAALGAAEQRQLSIPLGAAAEPAPETPADPLRAALEGLDPDRMTPIEALNALARLKQL